MVILCFVLLCFVFKLAHCMYVEASSSDQYVFFSPALFVYNPKNNSAGVLIFLWHNGKQISPQSLRFDSPTSFSYLSIPENLICFLFYFIPSSTGISESQTLF